MRAEQIAEEILAQCVAGRTLQIARVVASHYEQALSSSGVTPQQLTLLSMICKMGSASASAMLPYLKMDQSTLSRNLDRMVGKGWLDSLADETDGRRREYRITAAGTTALKDAHAAWREAQVWAQEALGTSGTEGLKNIAHSLNPLLPTDNRK